MNYISLNGYKSTLIKGLLISELPPITKPLQRNKVEEIDGRDGDIVTKLGYAAYDKKMTIGCYGDFNIDDIIQYFDSEGEVIFSNEPDKYYRYKILQAIDFERLLRFKTANVTFHVQPFKYSSVSDKAVFTLSAASGSIVVRNMGNVVSRPVITISGTGAATIKVGSNSTISISTIDITVPVATSEITLDVETLNATSSMGAVYRNRDVTGDLKYLALEPGVNTITYTGNINSIIFEKSSRWI